MGTLNLKENPGLFLPFHVIDVVTLGGSMWNLDLLLPPLPHLRETCVEWISQQVWPLGKENLERTWVLPLQG